ncbi:MAG: hypothetical protein AAF928_01740, partial [Myxococcota bacterium]
MRYLYGDSSAFPLNENFIETLGAATDCAVTLIGIDEKLHRARHTQRQVETAAAKEHADVDRMAGQLEAALEDDTLSKATAKVIADVKASASTHFERARRGIDGWRDSTIEKAFLGTGPADIMAPLDRFFTRHELPYTAWGLRWRAGETDAATAAAQVYAVMQRGLTATLSVAFPEGHLWSQAVRVGHLERKLGIELMGKNWRGREKMKEEVLDRLFVTKLTRTSERHAFELGRRPREGSAGFRFVMRVAGQGQPTVQRLDGQGDAEGEPVELSQLDALKVKKLWRQIEEGVADLVHHRDRLLASTFHEQRVTELPTPIKVAMVIIQSVAPLARDMVSHSRTPGELQLKRDLGDGRREELFVSAATIVQKYGALTSRSRGLFGALGLEPGRSADFDLQTSYTSIPPPATETVGVQVPSILPPGVASSGVRASASSSPPCTAAPLPHDSGVAARDAIPTIDVDAELVPPPPALPSEVGPASAIVPVSPPLPPPPPLRRALPGPSPSRPPAAQAADGGRAASGDTPSSYTLPKLSQPPPKRRRSSARA